MSTFHRDLRKPVSSVRRIAAQREDVLDPLPDQPIDDLRDLAFASSDAGEVRHRRRAELLLDPRHDLDGAVARAPAGAVGHGHEVGVERLLEVRDGRHERSRALVGLRREELEAEHGLPAAVELADLRAGLHSGSRIDSKRSR